MDEKSIKERLDKLRSELNEIEMKRLTKLGAISALENLLNDESDDSVEVDEVHVGGSHSNSENKSKEKEKPKKKYVYDDGYTINMSNRNKVLFVIKQFGRFTHSREIAEVLHEREPELEVEEWLRKVSSALSNLKRKETLVNYSVNDVNRDTFWGAPHWMDEEGEIKDEYMYNEDMVQYSGETIEL